jgi:hypothetical protein
MTKTKEIYFIDEVSDDMSRSFDILLKKTREKNVLVFKFKLNLKQVLELFQYKKYNICLKFS